MYSFGDTHSTQNFKFQQNPNPGIVGNWDLHGSKLKGESLGIVSSQSISPAPLHLCVDSKRERERREKAREPSTLDIYIYFLGLPVGKNTNPPSFQWYWWWYRL